MSFLLLNVVHVVCVSVVVVLITFANLICSVASQMYGTGKSWFGHYFLPKLRATPALQDQLRVEHGVLVDDLLKSMYPPEILILTHCTLFLLPTVCSSFFLPCPSLWRFYGKSPGNFPNLPLCVPIKQRGYIIVRESVSLSTTNKYLNLYRYIFIDMRVVRPYENESMQEYFVRAFLSAVFSSLNTAKKSEYWAPLPVPPSIQQLDIPALMNNCRHSQMSSQNVFNEVSLSLKDLRNDF